MSEQHGDGVVKLVDPGVPADQGLSSLGLLMQLAGSLFAAYASISAFVLLVVPTGRAMSKGFLLIVVGLCILRSGFHRVAGTELLYGKRNLEGLRRYIAIALAQTAIIALILVIKVDLPVTFVLAIAAGLAAWPVALAVLLQLPRFQRFKTEIPVSEDKGFEAAAILMTVLGTCGVLGTGACLLVMLDAGERVLSQGPGVLILIALVMLVIRSGFHIQAGVSGLRETGVDLAVERSNRYANFGVLSSFCAAGAMLLVAMMSSINLAIIAGVAGVCWLLMAWPMIIRRFFTERQFAELMAGAGADVHRRAPDAGLTGLGWLLFGHAMLGATFLIPQLVLGTDAMSSSIAEMLSFMGPSVMGLGTRSLWWSAGIVTLQAWAGYELIRMSPTSRPIATAYAIVAGAVTVYVMWPLLQNLKILARVGPEVVMTVVPLAIQLVLPVATLVLVNRTLTPTARARFRPRHVAPSPPT